MASSKTLRLLPYFAVMAWSAGCSGAAATDLFGAPSTEQSNAEPGASNPNPGNGTGSTDASTGGRDAKVDGPSSDAGVDGSEPDPDPDPSCTSESEPNNTQMTADPFESSYCGRISNGSDLDHAAFKVPTGVTNVAYKLQTESGNVDLKIFSGGIQLPLLGDGNLLVLPGATYVVQLRRAGDSEGSKPSYRFQIAYE